MKITLPILALALLAGLLASLGCWTWTVTHTFTVPDPWLQWLLFYLRHTLDAGDLRPIAFWSVLKGFAPAIAVLWVINELDDTDRSVRLLRGARLVSGKDLARKTRNKSQQQVEIAGVPMPLACESNHLLLSGSTNTGKSTAVDELLSFAIARGDRAIVIDPNGHALARFGKKGDTVLNPFDKRGKGWSIFNELRKPYDVERFAKSVIPDSGDASAQQWHGYAQQLFAETVRALTRNCEMTTERLLYWLTQASTEELKGLLAGTAASGLFEPGADKALASTRFILSHHIGAFQYLQPGDFSLRTWLETGEGNLYITWREDMLTALRPLVSAWTDILIASILTLPDDQPRPLWLSLDELASLEHLNSLEAGLTKGRKHGLRVVAGIQAVSQLDAIYGQHKAQTLRSCFRNLLALGGSNSDPDTAEVISKGLGERQLERTQTTHNNGKDGTTSSTSKHQGEERAVMASQLMSLPPLRGYLKFAGDYPIGEIRLEPKDYPVRAKPFVER
ncbi:type IV secretion system DNA-binding domain-containing protein [Duganella sp. HH105]|uniref:type IV secretion system DNA-binding domain-containing protein n=1 Tax=Duganella sp. HH105 TaxID=1781067 RepID=UPI000877B26C|nr:type IV secretion system DNA-binding domain-containing protein [Duganella sp. HH105]OEZ51827.1 coupling protein TraD [Duganella sp. HH105]